MKVSKAGDFHCFFLFPFVSYCVFAALYYVLCVSHSVYICMCVWMYVCWCVLTLYVFICSLYFSLGVFMEKDEGEKKRREVYFGAMRTETNSKGQMTLFVCQKINFLSKKVLLYKPS